MENTPQNQKMSIENGIGPIIGSLIIVIVLIIAALYIWGEHLNTAAQMQTNENLGTTTTIIYSTSTEPIDIQNDLKANPTIQNRGF
jgi:hypothetical protein